MNDSRDLFQVLRRRKWIVLAILVVLPLGSVLLALQKEPQYEAAAEVLLSRQNLAAALTDTADASGTQDANRFTQTQARLARSPLMAQRVRDLLRLTSRSAADIEMRTSVTAAPDADVLVFRVRDPDPRIAQRVATTYAREFTVFRRELDTISISRARREVDQRIASLETAEDRRSPLYASLVDKSQLLGTMEALQTSNSFLTRQADGAIKVEPRPVRTAVVTLAFALLLGIGAALLRDSTDTRVRSAEEIGQRLHLPLLARIPEPSRELRARDALVMIEHPHGQEAEAFRVLRTNLDFANLDRSMRTILVTSALEAEGKSTTAANLAVALARAGRRVVLVDLDLRRPFLARFFGLQDAPGVTEVALGAVPLEAALAKISFGEGGGGGPSQGNGRGEVDGVLEVLPAGPTPPDPGEFVATRTVREILAALASRADIVLIDSPPLVRVGDAMTLSATVDGLLVVTRLKVLRRPVVNELRRMLASTPAHKLGFVLTGAELEQGYAASGYYSYTSSEAEQREPARTA